MVKKIPSYLGISSSFCMGERVLKRLKIWDLSEGKKENDGVFKK